MIVLLRIDLKKPKKRDIEILTALALHLRGRAGRRAREAFLTLAGDYIPSAHLAALGFTYSEGSSVQGARAMPTVRRRHPTRPQLTANHSGRWSPAAP